MTAIELLHTLIEGGATITEYGFYGQTYVLAGAEIIAPGAFFYLGVDAETQHDVHVIKYTGIEQHGDYGITVHAANTRYYITTIEEQLIDDNAAAARAAFNAYKRGRNADAAKGIESFYDNRLADMKQFYPGP